MAPLSGRPPNLEANLSGGDTKPVLTESKGASREREGTGDELVRQGLPLGRVIITLHDPHVYVVSALPNLLTDCAPRLTSPRSHST